MVAAGLGRSISAQITVDVSVGTGVRDMLSFDSPTLGNSSVANYALSSFSPVVWNASNLAPFGSSMAARVGGSACAATMWTSDSCVAVHLAPGVQATLSFVTTVGVAVGSSEASASFDLLVLHQAASGQLQGSEPAPGSNAPAVLSTVVSLRGAAFGISSYSGAARLASSACSATVWIADSVVKCGAAAGLVLANTFSSSLPPLISLQLF